MSVRIALSQLSPLQQKRIATECTFKPVNRIVSYQEQEPCIFFLVENGYAYIPYYTASIILDCPFPNQHLKYPKVSAFEMVDGFELRPYQVDVLKDAMKQYNERGTCFFNVFCAFGKTVVAVYVAHIFSKLGYRTFITFPTDLIRKSWVGTVSSSTKAKCFVYDPKKECPADAQIILAMHTQLPNMPKELRRSIGHLVVDEAHLFCTENRAQSLLGFQPMYITLLTATYEKDNGLHVILDRLSGTERITKISSKPFYVWMFKTGIEPDPEKITHTPHGVNYGSIITALDNNPEKDQVFIDLVMANPNEKIIILVDHVEHANHLHQIITQAAAPRLVSKLTGKEKSYTDAHILVATYKKAGVGFDEKESCEFWQGIRFNMGIFSNAGLKVEQYAGRVGRAELTVIVDVIDNHRNLLNHSTQRKIWYKSRNGIIRETKKVFCWAEEFPKISHLYYQAAEDKEEVPDSKYAKYLTAKYLKDSST